MIGLQSSRPKFIVLSKDPQNLIDPTHCICQGFELIQSSHSAQVLAKSKECGHPILATIPVFHFLKPGKRQQVSTHLINAAGFLQEYQSLFQLIITTRSGGQLSFAADSLSTTVLVNNADQVSANRLIIPLSKGACHGIHHIYRIGITAPDSGRPFQRDAE